MPKEKLTQSELASNLNGNPSEQSFKTKQIDLFTDMLCNKNIERDDLSNTIHLWDSISKYYVTPRKMNKMRTENGFLPSIEHETTLKISKSLTRTYHIRIVPALIKDKNGKDIAFYPSANEEIIEEVLRKLASYKSEKKGNNGFYDNEKHIFGVVFTISQIKKELKAIGKTRSHAQIVISLDILAGSRLDITPDDGTGTIKSSFLPNLAVSSREKYLKDPKAKWAVHFHPLVGKSVNLVTYRQHNYKKVMSNTTQLTRWINKLLVLNFTYAAIGEKYNIRYSTIKRESLMLETMSVIDQIGKLEDSLEALVKAKVLTHYERAKIEKEGATFLDILYYLHPHPEISSEFKAANKKLLIYNQSSGTTLDERKKM